jgi:hypothetical protein
LKRIRTRRKEACATVVLAAAVFALNAYICWGLFGIEYIRHMGSVEGSFIGLARYSIEHWRDMTWFPLWHLGMPYANAYPPLLPWIVALSAVLRGISVPHAFHWVIAVGYCLGPVALFSLTLRLTGSRWTAFAAAAMYSLISWSAWLFPEIATDLGSRLHPRRLQALAGYGESPHVVSLTLVPFALLFVDLAMERRRAQYVLLASLGLAATVLMSWLGAFALALMIVAYFISRPNWSDLGRILTISIAAYCLAMPWATPSTIAATQFNSQTLGGDFRHTYLILPGWAAVVLIMLIAVKFAISRLNRELQFAIILVFLISSIVLPWVFWRIAVVPQPIRYHLELEMALSLLVALAGYAFLHQRARWAAATIGLMCVAMILPLQAAHRYVRTTLVQAIDITKTTEWKTAQWLNREWTGERVMMPGSTAFWLTAFSDVPQLNGGTEQGAIAYMTRVADYGIYYGPQATAPGRNGEFAILWLKALGVQAVGVSGPASGEFYKPYLDPNQFEGLLNPIWRDGDNVVYRVGAPRTSLARVIPREALVVRTPKNGIDVDPLRPYVAALDNPEMPRAEFHWNSMHSARITADPGPGQVVSIQIAWHKGWRATMNRQPLAIQRDKIGLMYLAPALAGPAEIDLFYDGGVEMRIARWISALTVLLLAGATARAILKKSW